MREDRENEREIEKERDRDRADPCMARKSHTKKVPTPV